MNGAGERSDGLDWRINQISTQLVVTDGVGSLNPEDVKKIVAMVLEHIHEQERSTAQRIRDTEIRDRAYRNDVG